MYWKFYPEKFLKHTSKEQDRINDLNYFGINSSKTDPFWFRVLFHLNFACTNLQASCPRSQKKTIWKGIFNIFFYWKIIFHISKGYQYHFQNTWLRWHWNMARIYEVNHISIILDILAASPSLGAPKQTCTGPMLHSWASVITCIVRQRIYEPILPIIILMLGNKTTI